MGKEEPCLVSNKQRLLWHNKVNSPTPCYESGFFSKYEKLKSWTLVSSFLLRETSTKSVHQNLVSGYLMVSECRRADQISICRRVGNMINNIQSLWNTGWVWGVKIWQSIWKLCLYLRKGSVSYNNPKAPQAVLLSHSVQTVIGERAGYWVISYCKVQVQQA